MESDIYNANITHVIPTLPTKYQHNQRNISLNPTHSMLTKLPFAWSDPNFPTPYSDSTSQPSASMADNPTVCPHGPKSAFQLSTPWQRTQSFIPQWQRQNCLLPGPQSTPNWLCFKKLQILRTIASGHNVIHTPAQFPIWGLLWQLWLSYPLRTSVNCTQYLCTWIKSRIVQSPTKLNDKI